MAQTTRGAWRSGGSRILMPDRPNAQIDALGERLRRGSREPDCIRELDRYRRSFVPAYEAVMARIRSELGLAPTGRPGKSTASIVSKLARGSMRLSQMQDIAGCRIIAVDRTDQDRLVAALSQLLPDARVLDLRVRPSHGYRAVHVVPMIDGYRVEVQVRTNLQHWWAELSETLALGHGAPELKYGGNVPGHPGTRDRLLLLSDVIAAFEESPDDLHPMSRLVTALGIGLAGYTMVSELKGQQP